MRTIQRIVNASLYVAVGIFMLSVWLNIYGNFAQAIADGKFPPKPPVHVSQTVEKSNIRP